MLAVIVTIEAVPGKSADLIAALEHNAAGSRLEPDCLRWEWSRHVDDPDRFAIYELYTSREAFAAHKESEYFAQWKKESEGCIAEKVAGQYEVTGPDQR